MVEHFFGIFKRVWIETALAVFHSSGFVKKLEEQRLLPSYRGWWT
jgi:hypothetical protein